MFNQWQWVASNKAYRTERGKKWLGFVAILIALVLLAVGIVVADFCCDSGNSVPRIESLSPASGGPGIKLVISGKGFGEKPYGKAADYSHVSVYFGEKPDYYQAAHIYSWTDTSITVRVPYHPNGSCKVKVFPTNGTSAEAYFEFTEAPDVYLKVIHQNIGVGGTEATADGYNFGPSQGKVRFGPFEAEVTYWSDTSVKFKVPEDAQPNAYVVKIVTGAGVESTKDLFVIPGGLEDLSAQKAVIQEGSQPGNSDDWVLYLLERSSIDPDWEVIAIGDPGEHEQPGLSFLALMVWDDEEESWHYLSRGPRHQWKDIEYKGEKMPSDIGDWDI